MAPTLTISPYRLTELRDKAGIKNDAELAQRLNIHPATLSRYKNGSGIDGKFIAAAHHVLGAELSDNLYQLDRTAELAA